MCIVQFITSLTNLEIRSHPRGSNSRGCPCFPSQSFVLDLQSFSTIQKFYVNELSPIFCSHSIWMIQNPELLLRGCRHCSSPYSCLLKRAAHILESSDDTQIFAFQQHSVCQLKQSSPLHFFPLFTSVAHLQVSLESKISRISRQQLYTFLCHLCSFFKKYIFINFIKNKELCTKLLLLQCL